MTRGAPIALLFYHRKRGSSTVKNEFTFPSRDGITSIHTVEWLPEGEVAAVVQIAHGISEYAERYEPFARYLTERGLAVVANDQLGHGKSVAEGGTAMHFGPKGSWKTVVDDLYTLRSRTGRRFPTVPYFLLGHSMGSFLVRTYLIRYPGTVQGALLLGTGWMSSPVLAFCDLVVAREIRRVGEDHVSPVANQLSFAHYNQRFAPNRTAYDWLSVNRENVDRFLADPQCGGEATVGLFRELLSGMRFNQSQAHLRQMNRHTPVLFAAGSMDPVGDCGRGVQRAARAFREAGMLDVTCKLYPGARHEILNDGCRETVYRDLAGWMERHIPALQTAASR